MFARYYKRYRDRPRRDCLCRSERKTCTYASLLYASRRDGITVHASADCGCHHKPQSGGNGLLRYINRWQHKEADIFVNHHILTGIPIFAEPDSLHIVSGHCSRLVPLEQVSCIREADGAEPNRKAGTAP